jgi:aminobenzoyl-glutamate transport protein
MSEAKDGPKTMMQRVLDVVEKVGNKVPHPAIIFLLLIAIVVVVSALLEATGTSHSTYEVIVPDPRSRREQSPAPVRMIRERPSPIRPTIRRSTRSRSERCPPRVC